MSDELTRICNELTAIDSARGWVVEVASTTVMGKAVRVWFDSVHEWAGGNRRCAVFCPTPLANLRGKVLHKKIVQWERDLFRSLEAAG